MDRSIKVHFRMVCVICLRRRLVAESILSSGFLCVRDHALTVYERDILHVARENFTKFTT